MSRVVQFVGGLFWVLSRPLRRRRMSRRANVRSGGTPWCGTRRQWTGQSGFMRAGVCVLIATLVWVGVGISMAVASTSATARVTGPGTDGCIVAYDSPDGRHQTGDIDCTGVEIGSTRTVWVLSDDPGDVMDPGFFIGGMLITTAVGALLGAGLVRLGRGRRRWVRPLGPSQPGRRSATAASASASSRNRSARSR